MINKEFVENNLKTIIAVGVLILVVLFAFAFIKSKEMIIQGEIESKEVNLSSKVPGRVKVINVEKGDEVKKDDILIELDTPDIGAKYDQAGAALELALAKQEEVNNGARIEQKQIAFNTLNQAKNNLELAKKTYDRVKNLVDEGVLPTQKLDEVTAQYKNAEKAVESANQAYKMYREGARYEDKKLAAANVKRAQGAVSEVDSYLVEGKIKSPIDGQVTNILVEEGELVGSGFTIITVVDNSDSWIVLNLREDLLQKIKIGSEFDVKIPAISKKNIKVRVDYISVLGAYATNRATKVRGDFDLKTFEVHARPVENVEGLRSGMTVVVDWNKVR